MTMIVATHADLAGNAPRSISPAHWHQSVGYARQACARVFRDGGTPADAIAAFGLRAEGALDWGRAVEIIADALCARPTKRVA